MAAIRAEGDELIKDVAWNPGSYQDGDMPISVWNFPTDIGKGGRDI